MNKKESATGNAAVRKLIAERAYELWENQGKPHGFDLIHWREAEQEIIDCLGPTQMDSARDLFGLLRDEAQSDSTVIISETQYCYRSEPNPSSNPSVQADVITTCYEKTKTHATFGRAAHATRSVPLPPLRARTSDREGRYRVG